LTKSHSSAILANSFNGGAGMQNYNNVPVLILAGGLGTRLSEETVLKPKPMVEIGDVPILVHIMRSYYAYGFNDFVICAGYRASEIKDYFLNYQYRQNHLEIDHRTSLQNPPSAIGHNVAQERWRVRVLDTGSDCMTGGRVARALDLIAKDHFSDFALTYGDGLSDVNLRLEYEYHQKLKSIGTLLAVRPEVRFGEVNLDTSGRVFSFLEKSESKQSLINAGFFFFKREFREFLKPDSTCILEKEPLVKLANESQLQAFTHLGFWHPMDTLRDKNYLQDLWAEGKAPWKLHQSAQAGEAVKQTERRISESNLEVIEIN
jgi:glucose-1-phosphate cytidylyltransferase